MFKQLLEQNVLISLDLYFADLHQPQTESERAFFAALMAVSRDGNLCLNLDESPFDSAFHEKIIEGSLTASSPFVKRYGNLFYLEKNFTYETRILQRLRDLSFPVKPLDFSTAEGLNAEQQQALQLALSNTLTVIEGGPGTGKTFLTSHLVRAMGPKARVILTAPTGKAAARLKQFNPQVMCGTLHSILGIKSEKHLARTSSYVQADLILVDECSMVDAKLLAFFLESLESGQRVVFLGDGHQLPPVESGSLFGDLVDLLPTAHLKKCLRSDRAEVLQLAQAILSGKVDLPHQPLSEEFIIQKAMESAGNSFCILSPLREGPFGVNVLNEKIFRKFYERMKPQEQMAVPILITRTDYEAGLFNGEMGVLWKTKEKPLYALFGDRKIPVSALPSYELGYVISVHKSQGSEFDHVIVAVPPGSERFGREVLYTAVTRARHSVILCGEAEIIANTVNHSSHRNSGLKLRWKSEDRSYPILK
jgi:exodeoxyribonuclease V alpha subunit